MSKSTFTIEEMDIKLKTNYIGTNFIFYDEIGSTNEELLKDNTITQHGSVLFADNQFKGRGRLSREWISYKDNSLTFSILLTEKLNAKTLNLMFFISGFNPKFNPRIINDEGISHALKPTNWKAISALYAPITPPILLGSALFSTFIELSNGL